MNRLSPTNTFSTDRFIHLLKRAFVLNRQQWLIGLLASAGIVMVIWVVPTLFIVSETGANRTEFLLPFAFMIFTLWGLLVTSDIFQELNTPSTAFQSLTLPATSTEKFVASWFLTVPIFLFVTIAAILLITLLSSLIILIFNGGFTDFNIYNPFDRATCDFAANYLFFNSLFLLGAIFFRKNNFLKTIAAFIGFMISFFILWSIFGWLLISFDIIGFISFEFIASDSTNDIIGFLFKWVITTTALLLAYVLLKRQQVA